MLDVSATDVYAYAATHCQPTPTFNIEMLKRLPKQKTACASHWCTVRANDVNDSWSKRPYFSICKVLSLSATDVFAYDAARCLPTPTLNIEILKRLAQQTNKRIQTCF